MRTATALPGPTSRLGDGVRGCWGSGLAQQRAGAAGGVGLEALGLRPVHPHQAHGTRVAKRALDAAQSTQPVHSIWGSCQSAAPETPCQPGRLCKKAGCSSGSVYQASGCPAQLEPEQDAVNIMGRYEQRCLAQAWRARAGRPPARGAAVAVCVAMLGRLHSLQPKAQHKGAQQLSSKCTATPHSASQLAARRPWNSPGAPRQATTCLAHI